MATALWPGLRRLLGYTPPVATPAYRPMPDEIRLDVTDDNEDDDDEQNPVCLVCNKTINESDKRAVEPAEALHTCGCEPLIHPGCYREWWLANGRCPQCNTESTLHDVVKFVIRGEQTPPSPPVDYSFACIGLTVLATFGSVVGIVLGTNTHGCSHQEPPPGDDDGWLISVGMGINTHP